MSGKELKADDTVFVPARVLRGPDDGGDLRVMILSSFLPNNTKAYAKADDVVAHMAACEAALQAKATLETLQPEVVDRMAMRDKLMASLTERAAAVAMTAIYRPEPAKPEPKRLSVTFKNFATEELEKAFGAGFNTLGDVVAQALEKAASRDDELKAAE